MSTIIAMWSGPRNLSTAMMRSFGSRSDCAVWDEPFFAPFLAATGLDHPGREETLARHETDPVTVGRDCAKPPEGGEPYYFQKHMPHHMLPDFPLDWAGTAKHFFLIREPARVLMSYAKGRPDFVLEDLGFGPQRKMFDLITAMTGKAPPVIDSTDILRAPEKALTRLCDAIDIPFDKAMLSWEKGSRPEDGAWAPYWYHSVENSSGFGNPPGEIPDVPAEFRDMLADCEAFYKDLRERCIKV